MLAALFLLKFRAIKLDVRMWMFLGTISGLTFGVLDFEFRVFVDGFERAVLNGLNNWSVSSFNSYWPGILVQAISLLLFLGYTMSASSIECQVRRHHCSGVTRWSWNPLPASGHRPLLTGRACRQASWLPRQGQT